MIDALSLVEQEALAQGFDPNIAVAVAKQESGGNPNAIGDAGCSYGLFQENTCGGAGETVLNNGGTLADLMNPVSSTDRFIQRYNAAAAAHLGQTPGEIAAAAQRPANPSAYASAIDALLGSSSPSSPPSPSPSPTPKQCPAGSKLMPDGLCHSGGGYGPPVDFLPTLPTPTPGATVGNPFDAIGGAIGNFQKGATQFGVGAIIVLSGLGLILYGLKQALPGPKVTVGV